jgi:hypothetical protein
MEERMTNRMTARARRRLSTLPLMVLSALVTGWILAATPPTLVNYQGVLRSSADAPLTGTYDMAFRFFDEPTAGVEIMIDQHTAAGANAVTVTGGLFDVALGGGTIADGSGPGTYTSLDAVFRDHAGVWLEIGIGGETLAPRTRIHSAPYSLNATSAANATQLAGQPASFYLDTSATTQTKLGRVKFDNTGGTGLGVEAYGPDGGGYFKDSNHSGYAYVGSGDYGIESYGNTLGGYFKDLDNSGYAYVGYTDYGIQAGGSVLGGYFHDSNSSGVTYAGYGDYGMQAYGNIAGGFFQDLNSSAYVYLGENGHGIRAYGSTYGGEFVDTNGTGYAYVGYGDYGIQGFGNHSGGAFFETNGSSSANAAFNDTGIVGRGSAAGGYFWDNDSTGWAYVGYGGYKIQGSGTVSFVQNHPTRKDRSIVYAAPEGDEVAVYTRGSGRLTKGEARVALGETFELVANPDIGVTAHVTPRGDARLWVHEVSPTEIVVRGPADADVAFDYIVYGLRIGFETLPIVQVKKDEAFLPTAATLAEHEAGQADTVASSAMVRFAAERQQLAGTPADLTRAGALAAQINAGREEWLANRKSEDEERRQEIAAARDTRDMPQAPAAQRVEPARASASTPAPIAVTRSVPPVEPIAEHERPAGTTLELRAAEATEAGEIVSLDPVHPGTAVKSSTPGEALIVGCALASGDGTIAIATAGVALCRVDASVASIDVGDLLIASSIEGHAMKHDGTLPTPAILGRAVDPLPVGAGLIRVLLGAR